MNKRIAGALALLLCTAAIIGGEYFRPRSVAALLPEAPPSYMCILTGTAGASFTEIKTGCDSSEAYERLRSLTVRRTAPSHTLNTGWYEILLHYPPAGDESFVLYLYIEPGRSLTIDRAGSLTGWKILS